jgi:hypothetical protein
MESHKREPCVLLTLLAGVRLVRLRQAARLVAGTRKLRLRLLTLLLA